MSDEVTIGNMALSHVGASSTIESLTEDVPQAAQVNIWYHPARKQVLKAHDWNFARKRQTLTTHGDDPPAEWAYRYQYPSDALSIRKMVNPVATAGATSRALFPDDLGVTQAILGVQGDPIPFVVEISDDGTMSILTDLETAVAGYTFDQTSGALFSPIFDEILSHLIAARIAFSLTGKLTIKNREEKTFQRLILTAPALDAQEMQARKPREAESIRGRA